MSSFRTLFGHHADTGKLWGGIWQLYKRFKIVLFGARSAVYNSVINRTQFLLQPHSCLQNVFRKRQGAGSAARFKYFLNRRLSIKSCKKVDDYVWRFQRIIYLDILRKCFSGSLVLFTVALLTMPFWIVVRALHTLWKSINIIKISNIYPG